MIRFYSVAVFLKEVLTQECGLLVVSICWQNGSVLYLADLPRSVDRDQKMRGVVLNFHADKLRLVNEREQLFCKFLFYFVVLGFIVLDTLQFDIFLWARSARVCSC